MTLARVIPAAALTLALAIGMAQPSHAAGAFECPAKPLEAKQAAAIKAVLPTGDAFDNVGQLNAAVTELKASGVGPVLIIDNLIAAYCPTVAAQGELSDAKKASLVNRFAARITRVVYSLEGADEVILDVSFPPAIVDAINVKAQAAGVSQQAFIRGAVDNALK
ncbi:hypothetical protein MWN33_04940 [Starkeya koreensis]|uniref:Glutelin n=1 Tax=Ancylobacter koreensis TaxID=266121 RepID=A0ABT0DJC3_9HYPH|nr:hypothetical protein [Ancylobacter koreensis]MCK0207376.1 hypothetical protein [Ancylobacter koreensis]